MRADAGRRPQSAQATSGGGFRHGSLPLGRWAGVIVEAHWSTLGTLGLFVSVLATAILPEGHPGESRATYWLVGGVTAMVFLATVMAHELAHAIVARHYGIKVDRITLWLLGGVTQIGGTSPSPRADALVAAAGPAMSLAIGAVTGCLAWWVGGGSLAGTAILWLATVSVLLGFFNLLPGAPLDGGRLVRAVAWWRLGDRRRAELVATRTGRVLGIVLLFLGLVETLAGRVAGLWLVLLGWFIMSGARAEEDAAGDQQLAGFKAADVMTPVSAMVADWLTLPQTVAQLAPALTTHPMLPVVDVSGRVTGVVTLADLESVPGSRRSATRVRDLTARHRPPMVLSTDQQVIEFVDEIRHRGRVGVVVEHGQPIGLVTSLELIRAAHLSLLGWRSPADHR
jgi:Zn-dependent protease